MLSHDQLVKLYFNRAAWLGAAQLARTLTPWLELRTSFHAGAFRASAQHATGGMLATTLGVAAQLPNRALRPWLGVDLGPGFTGSLVRPYMDLMLGIDARVDKRTSVGPVLSYGRMIQWNGKLDTSDASYLWLGISLRVRFDAPPAPPPPKPSTREVRVYQRVVEHRPPAPPPEPVVPDQDVLRLIEEVVPTMTHRTELLAPVLFKFDSDTLEPIGVAMLHEVAQQLATRPDIALLEIQGYADARGRSEYNQALSQRRGERVKSWLVEHGVAPERLRVAARGATAPVEAGREERAYQQNRRVIFRVIQQGGAP
jgi:outer membrane protein OmpA-like peptidoglycan-associated protein